MAVRSDDFLRLFYENLRYKSGWRFAISHEHEVHRTRTYLDMIRCADNKRHSGCIGVVCGDPDFVFRLARNAAGHCIEHMAVEEQLSEEEYLKQCSLLTLFDYQFLSDRTANDLARKEFHVMCEKLIESKGEAVGSRA